MKKIGRPKLDVTKNKVVTLRMSGEEYKRLRDYSEDHRLRDEVRPTGGVRADGRSGRQLCRRFGFVAGARVLRPYGGDRIGFHPVGMLSADRSLFFPDQAR